MAAILATLLVWFVTFGVDSADQAVLAQRERVAVEAEQTQATLDQNAQIQANLVDASTIARDTAFGNGQAIEAQLARDKASLANWTRAHDIVMWIKAPLPKTGETITLLSEAVTDAADLEGFFDTLEEGRIDATRRRANDRNRDVDAAVQRERAAVTGEERASERYAGRSWWWSLGTSFLFQGVLVCIACWIFARRDL